MSIKIMWILSTCTIIRKRSEAVPSWLSYKHERFLIVNSYRHTQDFIGGGGGVVADKLTSNEQNADGTSWQATPTKVITFQRNKITHRTAQKGVFDHPQTLPPLPGTRMYEFWELSSHSVSIRRGATGGGAGGQLLPPNYRHYYYFFFCLSASAVSHGNY